MKETNLKRWHILWFQIYDILEKISYGDIEKINGCQELGIKEGSLDGAQRIFRAMKLFHVTAMVDICHYTFVKVPRMYNVEWTLNYGFWVIVMCQCKLSVTANVPLRCNMLIVEEGCVQGAGCMWELSVLTTQLCCEPKTSPKHKSLLTMNKWINNYILRRDELNSEDLLGKMTSELGFDTSVNIRMLEKQERRKPLR